MKKNIKPKTLKWCIRTAVLGETEFWINPEIVEASDQITALQTYIPKRLKELKIEYKDFKLFDINYGPQQNQYQQIQYMARINSKEYGEDLTFWYRVELADSFSN